MRDSLPITDIVSTPASAALQATGLLRHVACTVDFQLRLDGLALRRKARRGYAISFPERRDAQGVKHPYMRPIDARARAEIERQIIGTLRARGVIP